MKMTCVDLFGLRVCGSWLERLYITADEICVKTFVAEEAKRCVASACPEASSFGAFLWSAASPVSVQQEPLARRDCVSLSQPIALPGTAGNQQGEGDDGEEGRFKSSQPPADSAPAFSSYRQKTHESKSEAAFETQASGPVPFCTCSPSSPSIRLSAIRPLASQASLKGNPCGCACPLLGAALEAPLEESLPRFSSDSAACAASPEVLLALEEFHCNAQGLRPPAFRLSVAGESRCRHSGEDFYGSCGKEALRPRRGNGSWEKLLQEREKAVGRWAVLSKSVSTERRKEETRRRRAAAAAALSPGVCCRWECTNNARRAKALDEEKRRGEKGCLSAAAVDRLACLDARSAASSFSPSVSAATRQSLFDAGDFRDRRDRSGSALQCLPQTAHTHTQRVPIRGAGSASDVQRLLEESLWNSSAQSPWPSRAAPPSPGGAHESKDSPRSAEVCLAGLRSRVCLSSELTCRFKTAKAEDPATAASGAGSSCCALAFAAPEEVAADSRRSFEASSKGTSSCRPADYARLAFLSAPDGESLKVQADKNELQAVPLPEHEQLWQWRQRTRSDSAELYSAFLLPCELHGERETGQSVWL